MSLRAAVPLYQNRGSVLVTPPASEPVTAAELRLHLNTDAVAFPDAGTYVTDARQEIENMTGVAFLTQTWRLALDRWPAAGEAWWDGVRETSISELYGRASNQSVAMPKWPLVSITSITVYDEDGTSSAVNVGQTFDVDLYRRPGRITLKRGVTWPIAMRANNAIEIVYVAGYPSAATVPGPMKRAVKQLAGFLYSHRGDDCNPAEAFVSSGAAALMDQYKPARV